MTTGLRPARVGKRHGLTRQDRELMFARQQGMCAICQRPIPSVDDALVDHDHGLARVHGHAVHTGCPRCVRGLLCRPCNSALGWFEARSLEVVRYATRLRAHG